MFHMKLYHNSQTAAVKVKKNNKQTKKAIILTFNIRLAISSTAPLLGAHTNILFLCAFLWLIT